MLNESTTLASFARVIGDTLQRDYDVDPGPLIAAAGIDPAKFHRPGARVVFSKMDRLWSDAVEATGDDWFGLKVGENADIGDFYVLGHAWLASATLRDALERSCKFAAIVSTEMRNLELQKCPEGYSFVETFPEPTMRSPQVSEDAGYVAFLRLIEFLTNGQTRPLRVSLPMSSPRSAGRYEELFQCPIEFGKEPEAWVFAAADLEAPLTGSIPDIASAADEIAERYLLSVDQGSIATEVRQLLIHLLPSGSVDQERVAANMHRSTSTLQRQLSAEGTSYRDILETTRKHLAQQYLRNSDYSQAEIAFMVGFSDQSNFSRAFKRWTGMSPRQYQSKAAA